MLKTFTKFHDLQERYLHDGFLVLPNKLPSQLISHLKEEISRYVADYEPTLQSSVFRTDTRDKDRDEAFLASAYQVHGFLESEAYNDQGQLTVPKTQCLNKLGHALHDYLPALNALANEALIKEAFQIAGHKASNLVQTMVIFKQPHIGGRVRWHQDASYLITKPSSVVGLWIALEDATKENGCLWMAPGQHHSPLRELYTVDWQSRQGHLEDINNTPWPNSEEELAIEVEAGTIVIFHDHMPHRSAPNQSDKSRVAVTLHAYDTQSAWPAHNWLHRQGLKPFIL